MRHAGAAMAAGLVGMLAAAMPAAAGDFSFNLGIGHGRNGTRVGVGVGLAHGQQGTHVGVGVGVGRVRAAVAVAPVMPVRAVVPTQRMWVAPVYKVVTERVWVPTVQTQYRDVPVTDAFGHVIAYRREACTVSGGYWQNVQRQVLVREGRWVTSVASGHLKRYHGVGGKAVRPLIAKAVRAGFIR